MARKIRTQIGFFLLAASFLLMFLLSAAAQQQTASQERIAAFKQAIQQSQAQLQSYEWIETTTVLLKGEVKSQKQNRCYYGADGKIQKVPINATPESQPSGRRLKRKIIAKKKGEMTDYMERAVNLIHRYVPPEPGMIQSAKDNGKATLDAFEPNKIMRLSLNDIIKVGDLMSATLDIKSNAILNIDVSTYLDDAQDGVKFAVVFQRLPDGTSYNQQMTLDARAKNIKVVVENTGHRRVN